MVKLSLQCWLGITLTSLALAAVNNDYSPILLLKHPSPWHLCNRDIIIFVYQQHSHSLDRVAYGYKSVIPKNSKHFCLISVGLSYSSATIFGDVLLRSPASERKSKSKRALNALNRKKAAFIYQFLVNDLTNPYH